MTADELKRRYPNASASFIKRNLNHQDKDGGICAVQPKPTQRVPLDAAATREETCWYDADDRFEISFVVYSTEPCDWDGYDIKSLQDWVVKAGFVPNDGWKTLSGRVVSKKAATKEEEKTVVVITRLFI